MPVGPYKTFGLCVAAMKGRGYSVGAARRICDSIEAQQKKAAEKKA